MPKPNKSSASAGTRKKHAKKTQAKEGEDGPPGKAKPQKLQRGQKKLSKAQQRAQPKVKQYVPPPRPPALLIPDPLDGQGLARTLPAELVVVLRRLGKKDDVTRRKGLEELKEWVEGIRKTGLGEEEEVEREIRETALESAIPVWMHNLASLLQSPFHRSTAIQLHSELLSIPSLRTAILDTLSLSLLPGTQNRDILGSWLVAALEEGRRAGGVGLRSWEDSTIWLAEGAESDGRIDLGPQLSTLAEYLSLAILDPPSLHDDIHPSPVASTPAPPAPPKAKGKGKQAFAPAPPTPAEPTQEESEHAGEKWARYRVGGLVGLSWVLQQLQKVEKPLSEEITRLLRNPALWSCLSSLPSDEGSAAFGYQHSPVRRSAYLVLRVLVESYPEEIEREEMLQALAGEMLDAVWLEKEGTVWEAAGPAVVKILSKHREIWNMSKSSARTEETNESKGGDEEAGHNEDEDEDDEDGSDEEDEGEDEDEEKKEEPESTTEGGNSAQTTQSSIAFDRFLEFVSTICPTIPHHTYPLLLVIISTLPTTLLPLTGDLVQLKTLFAHLWSPVDARLLSTHALPGQPSAFQAFLRDAVDCTTFLISKASKVEDGESAAEWLVVDQLGERVWKEGVLELGGRSAGRRAAQGVRSEQEATIFGQALSRLVTPSPQLGSKLLDLLVLSTTQLMAMDGDDKKAVAFLPRLLPVIDAVRAVNEDKLVNDRLDDLVAQAATICVQALQRSAQQASPSTSVYTETLVEIIRSHAPLVPPTARSEVVQTIETSSQTLVSSLSPALFISLLDALASTDQSDEKGLSDVLSRLSQDPAVDRDTRFAVTTSLLAASSALVSGDALDHIAEEAAQTALADEASTAGTVAASCVVNSKLSSDSLHMILALVSTSIHDSVYDLLSAHPEAKVPQAAIEIFAAYATSHLPEVIASDIFSRALVGLHHLVVLLPRLREAGHAVPSQAKDVWAAASALEGDSKATLVQQVLGDLAGLIQDIGCRVEPSILVDVSLVIDPTSSPSDIALRILPETEHIQQLVAEYTSRPPNPSLTIVDPLITAAASEADQPSTSKFDAHGRSKAARLAEAALAFIRADRSLASTNPTMLQTVMSARALAQDALAVPGASRGFFDSSVAPSYVEDITREAEGALSFSLAAFDEVSIDWHRSSVEFVKKGDAASGDSLQRMIVTLAQGIKGESDDVAARTLRDVLSRHLRQSGAGEKEAEVWLAFGLSKAETNPTLSLAVLLAVKPMLIESKSFETAQNRLASSLSGVPSRQANDKGVPALRLLAASAPPADAAAVFIPQQRAMFVLRHVAGWLTSDDADDLNEEVEYRIAQVYTALAPVVQSMPGGHWDSIFDLIETGLDSASLDDPASLALLHQCLLLLREVRDLCETNKSLRADWTSKKTHLSLVFKLFLQCRDADSVPVQQIQDLLLDLLRDAGDVVGDQGLPELSLLLGKSTSASVQTTAYRLLSQVIRRRTLALVLEVEASISEVEEDKPTRVIELPQGLVEIIERGVTVDWHEEPAVDLVLGQLLAWMSVLDHFDDASRTLRWAYLDQLNSSNMLVNSLVPMLFAILGVSEVGAWNFPASQFAVDEFYPDLLDPEDLADLAPLASHVFYRALVTIPSAVRTYYESLKDRQLSMSMLNFTARHYSPVIIQHEFAALRRPESMAQLTEEGLNIRIAQGGGATTAASAGASEAIASYVVDEQPMEIGIRLPAEFPLRGVDVRDLRRVGVPENKWRGWLMSVQQTITSRNGLILEALTVFKKNVSLHFEGVVECAICYSIISLTDRTLPTKPCRTCKNRFHASCLYKWFNSSHSSSCPLCRALF